MSLTGNVSNSLINIENFEAANLSVSEFLDEANLEVRFKNRYVFFLVMNAKLLLFITLVLLLVVGCAPSKDTPANNEAAATEEDNNLNEDINIIEEEAINESALNENIDAIENTEESKEEPVQTISVLRGEFKPATLKINKGETVLWKNNDLKSFKHIISIYSKDRGVISPQLVYGDEFRHTFNQTGEFVYIDLLFKENMKGKVIVE